MNFSTVINAPINEPPLPRRKKCPELAYRHHEFIADSSNDQTDSNVTRARVSLFVVAVNKNVFLFLFLVLFLSVLIMFSCEAFDLIDGDKSMKRIFRSNNFVKCQ